MKYDAAALARAGDQYLGRSYSEMDCQAFVEKCMSDVGYGRNLAGSNAWYRAMDWTGPPEECVSVFGCVPAGALLFILEDDGKEPAKYRGDGIGNASHIGIKTGRGDGAIHSSKSRGGVATSVFKDKTIKNGGWNRVGLLRVFDYGKSVNWVLEHGQTEPGAQEAEKGDEPLTGIVTAENGGTVKLRQKPSTDCGLWWDVSVGTEVRIIERGDTWTKCVADGRTGWMKNEYIRIDVDDGTGPGDDPGIEPGTQVEITMSVEDALIVRDAIAVLKNMMDQINERLGGNKNAIV